MAAINPIAIRDHQLRVQFTGSGSEYFRIWIVNLALVLVTLGIYFPWAKVRRLRYFYGRTEIAGAPLDFHGDPKKMLRGYALTGTLVLLYSVAGNFSATAGLVAFILIAALWPALFKSSLQFRMANTSWRGLRFRFTGPVAGAYKAMVPLFVPGILVLGGVIFVPDETKPPSWYFAFLGGVIGAMMLAAPWLWWNLKSYQHNHYAFAQQQTELRSTVGAFYLVFLKTLGVMLLAIAALAGVLFSLGALTGLSGPPGPGAFGAAFIAIAVGVLGGVLVVQFLPRPYFTSRMQNLLWSRTGNSSMRFRSRLEFTALLGLTVKNWLLMVLTLGLYWPFAAIALARMRLQAVSLTSRVDPESLIDRARAQQGEAAGDAAADLLGLDIGL
ncbi:MAG: YjgN family protein [Burkholderiaceae bacterium]